MDRHYRADIDGLRALAVLSVVLFHAFPGHFQGGFVGVDVFFVISGYLITGDLYRRSTSGPVSIVDFYRRRVRRIFPALILLFVAVLAFGAASLSAFAFRQLGLEVASGAGFVANLYYWQTLSYFSSAGITNPLLHLWSLGVEEQFYAIWPLLIFGLARLRRRMLGAILLIAALSFLYSLHAIRSDPTEAFFSPLPRLWELALGGALALVETRMSAGLRHAVSMAGLAGLLLAFGAVREIDFPGWQALLPVLSTVAIIAAAPEAVGNRLLASRGLVAIGLISYPLYLWHWPILSFSYMLNDYDYGSARLRAMLMLGALLLATMTFLFVEKRGRLLRPLLLVGLIAAAGVSGWASYAMAGWPSRPIARNPAVALIGRYQQLHQEGLSSAYLEKCDFLTWGRQEAKREIDASCIHAGSRPVWMIWGDSHAQALSLGIRRAVPAGVDILQVATSACTPQWPDETRATQAPGATGTACVRSNELATATIRRASPDVLIVTMDEGFRGRDWNIFADQARRLGARHVVLVGPVPQFSPSLPIMMARALPAVPPLLPSIADPLDTDRYLAAIPARSFIYVSPIAMVCTPAGQCLTSAGKQLLEVDGSHLSPAGSIFLGQRLARAIVASPGMGKP